MKADKPVRKLLLLACLASILIPLSIYLLAFYNYLTNNPNNIPLHHPEFLGEVLLPIAVLSCLAALLAAVTEGIVVYLSKKPWRLAKLTAFFGILFIFYWALVATCAYYFLIYCTRW